MDYQNGQIYSIRSYQSNDVYYGSTVQPLTKRLSAHKNNFKRWKNEKYSYVTSFDIIKYNDCYIELVEKYPCKSKTELQQREGQIIRQNNDAINKKIEGRTQKEYNEDNKDRIKIQTKEYYNKNKVKILLRHKEHDKEYRNKNKDLISYKKKIMYKKNKQINQLNMINKMWLDFQ